MTDELTEEHIKKILKGFSQEIPPNQIHPINLQRIKEMLLSEERKQGALDDMRTHK